MNTIHEQQIKRLDLVRRWQEKALRKSGLEYCKCNVCQYYGPFNAFGITQRPNAVCPVCGSFERTRLIIEALQHIQPVNSASHVLDIAPSKASQGYFKINIGCHYTAIDIDPASLMKNGIECKYCDLCDATLGLEDRYDIIMNVHVLEHVRCNPLDVISKLNDLLQPGGVHLISVPFAGNRTLEDMCPSLSDDERLRRFGHPDHMRAFGHIDFPSMMHERFGDRFQEFDTSVFANKENTDLSLGLNIKANRLFCIYNN